MKNVWILNHYAKDPSDSGGTRHFHLVEHLKAYGWCGHIIAASVDHATGNQRLGVDENFRLEILQDVNFLWIKTPTYSGNGSQRLRNILSYFTAVLRPQTTYKLPRPDVVIGSSVHPFAALAALILANRLKVPFIFEVRDLWPQTLIDLKRLQQRSLIAWVLRKLEIVLYKRSSRIVVLLPLAWQYIVPLGISKKKVVWIPNGVDLSLFPRHPCEKSSPKDNFTFMYFGTHGQANGLHILLQAMAHLQEISSEVKIHLRLIGAGPLKANLIEKSKSMGLVNISFEPPVRKNEITILAAQADAFVIPILNLPQLYRFGISPNKLFDYFAAERPSIIAADIPGNPVAEANAGFVVTPEQPFALAEAMLRMACMPFEERKIMGRNGRDYVEKNHSFDQLSARLADVLDDVCAVTEKIE